MEFSKYIKKTWVWGVFVREQLKADNGPVRQLGMKLLCQISPDMASVYQL